MPRGQRWPYPLGGTLRAEVFLDFVDPDGKALSQRLLVDTGFEHTCIIKRKIAIAMNHGTAHNISLSNYPGPALGFVMNIRLQSVGFEGKFDCYSHPLVEAILGAEFFDGLVGFRFLKDFIYGGDSVDFFLER